MAVTPAAIVRAKRRPRFVQVLLSASLTLAIFGLGVVAASVVSYAVSPDEETTTSYWIGFAVAAAIFIAAVNLLILRAYPPGHRRWSTWIVLTVLLALIPLIVLPWLAVTKKHWSMPTDEELAGSPAPPDRGAWIIAGAIVLAAVIIAAAVVAVAATSERDGSGGSIGSSAGEPSGSGSFGPYDTEEAYGAYWGSFSGCGQQSLEQLATSYGVPARAESVARAHSLTAGAFVGGGEEVQSAAYDGCLDVLAMSSAKAQGYATCGSYTLDELADLYATSPDTDSVSRAVAQELGGDAETYQGCVEVLEKFGPG